MSEEAKQNDEDAVCENCGKYGAVEIGDQKLCPDCITNAGCACGGNGHEDE